VRDQFPPLDGTLPPKGLSVTLGVEGDALGIFGVTLGTGVVVGTTGCPAGGMAAGGYGTGGAGVGADVSAGIALGVYRTGVSGLRGSGSSLNFNAGPVGVSIAFGSDGQWLGASVGPGVGMGASGTLTGTGLGVIGRGMNVYGECR
jgi:hypothetical protein